MNLQINTSSREGKALKELLDSFMIPSFGSVTKRELELKYFKILQDLGYIKKNSQPYELVSNLKVSRQKARNLLYESSLRMSEEEELDTQLQELLMQKNIMLDKGKVLLEIYNPYLIDYLKNKMSGLNLGITDSSFSSELVKMSCDSYGALYEAYATSEAKKNVYKFFLKLGFQTNITLGNMLKGFLKAIGDKTMSDEGKQMAEKAYNELRVLLAGQTVVNSILDADLLEILKKYFS